VLEKITISRDRKAAQLKKFLEKNRKSLLVRFLIGAHKGLTTSTLPQEILNLQNNPLIRIIRFLGGISLITILGRSYITLTGIYLYFAFFFTCIFFMYNLYISYHRTKHIYKILKSDELDIRNSPLDRFASAAARVLLCGKGFCQDIQPVGTALGIMLASDEILKAANRQPFFTPFLGNLVNMVFPGKPQGFSANELTSILEKMNAIKAETKDIESASNILQKEGNFPSIDANDKKEFAQGLEMMVKANDEQLSSLQKKVKDLLDMNSKK